MVAGRPLFGAGGDSEPQHPVGARVEANDGRVFRYVFATPTALVAGQLQQGPAEKTNHQNRTAPVAAIGATSLTVDLGATLAQLNEYAGGLMVVTVTPGQGYSYRIKGHPAAASDADILVTLEDPLEVALTADSRVDFVHNPYNGVIVNPTTATGPVVGVAVDVIDAGKYGWIQSGGLVGCLANGAITVGANVAASAAVAGSVIHAGSLNAVVGYAATGIATTDYGAIFLTLD